MQPLSAVVLAIVSRRKAVQMVASRFGGVDPSVLAICAGNAVGYRRVLGTLAGEPLKKNHLKQNPNSLYSDTAAIFTNRNVPIFYKLTFPIYVTP